MRLLSFLVLASLAISVDAGCHPHGKRSPEKTQQLKDKGLYSASGAKPTHAYKISELPSKWDWCNVDGQSFCTASWNQHIPMYCGACWVHGALGAVNDRVKIALHGKHDLMLARQVILNCAQSKGFGAGCNGGDGQDVFEYMHRYGLPDESCQIYMAKSTEKCDAAAICHNCMPVGEDIFPYKCWAVEDPAKVYVKEYGIVRGEAAMMSEIIERGPITCGFASVDDFDYNYRGGVYIDTTNATDVNHDVEIVGWGEMEDGTKYWKARNSWGTYWGENGFFRIVRGINNMLIEDECTFAIPDVREHKAFLDGKFGGSMYGIVPKGKKTKTPVGVPEEGEAIFPATFPPVTPKPGSKHDPDSYPDAEKTEDEAVSKHGKATPTDTPASENYVLASIDYEKDHDILAKQGQKQELGFLNGGVQASGYNIPQVKEGYDMGTQWQKEAKAQGWGGDSSGQLKSQVGGASWVNGGWQKYMNGAQAGGAGGANWQQYMPQTVATIDTTTLTSRTSSPDITVFQHRDDAWIHIKHPKLDHAHTKDALKGYQKIATKYADVYVKNEKHVKHHDDVDEEIVIVNKEVENDAGAMAGGGGGAGAAGDWQKYIPKGVAGAGGAGGAGVDWQQYIPQGVQTGDAGAPVASDKDTKPSPKHDDKHATHAEIDTTTLASTSTSDDFAAYIRRGSDWTQQDTPRLVDLQKAWAVNAFRDYDRLSTKYVDVYVLHIDGKKHHKKDDVEEQIIVVTKENEDSQNVGAIAGGGGGAGSAGNWQQYIPKGVAAGGAGGGAAAGGAGGIPDWQQYIPQGVRPTPTPSYDEKPTEDDSISEKQYDKEQHKHHSKHAHHNLAEDPAIRDAILDILRKHGIHPNQEKSPQVSNPSSEDPNLSIKRAIADALTRGDDKASQVKDSIKQALKQIQDEWLDETDRQAELIKQNHTHAVKNGVHDVAGSIGDLIRSEEESASQFANAIQDRAIGSPQTAVAVDNDNLPTHQSPMLNFMMIFAIIVVGIVGYVYHSRAKQDYLPIQ